MSETPKYMFVLIGSPGSGKTWLQKKIIEDCCNIDYEHLPSNSIFDIVQSKFKSIFRTIFFSGRSLQETMNRPRKVTFRTIKEYFERIFQEIEICFIASHVYINDLDEIVKQGKNRGYKVIGVLSKPRIRESEHSIEEIEALGFDQMLITNRGQLGKNRSDILEPIFEILRGN